MKRKTAATTTKKNGICSLDHNEIPFDEIALIEFKTRFLGFCRAERISCRQNNIFRRSVLSLHPYAITYTHVHVMNRTPLHHLKSS